MRKSASLVILLGAIITLFLTYAILQAQQAPRWQIKLDNYLKYRNDTLSQDPLGSGTVTVEQVARARHHSTFIKLETRSWLWAIIIG